MRIRKLFKIYNQKRGKEAYLNSCNKIKEIPEENNSERYRTKVYQDLKIGKNIDFRR